MVARDLGSPVLPVGASTLGLGGGAGAIPAEQEKGSSISRLGLGAGGSLDVLDPQVASQ